MRIQHLKKIILFLSKKIKKQHNVQQKHTKKHMDAYGIRLRMINWVQSYIIFYMIYA